MREYSSLLMKREISNGELAKIIGGAKRDDADSMEKLCVYVYPRVYRYIYYRVNHHENAEDLTSEVVLKIVQALKKQRGNFRAWMYKIARNAVIDFYRRRGVRSEVSLSDMPGELPDESAAFSERVLTQEKLRRGLHHLTEEQKQVILLKFIEGYSNDDVANIMGKSIGAVKVLQFRALRSLREYFRKKGYEIKD